MTVLHVFIYLFFILKQDAEENFLTQEGEEITEWYRADSVRTMRFCTRVLGGETSYLSFSPSVHLSGSHLD